jgi:hypothetical protein
MKIHDFDVLVVYTDSVAKSAANKLYKGTLPFPAASREANYNLAYAYFLDACRESGLRAAFTTSADVSGPGSCRSYWLHRDNAWKRIGLSGRAPQIFTKFSPVNRRKRQQRDLLFSTKAVRSFDNDALRALFFDKQGTYERLEQFTIPTEAVTNATREGIRGHLRNLRRLIRQHPGRGDFSGAVIAKDRFGAGGNDIYQINDNFSPEIYRLLQANKKLSLVLQPFVRFQKGYAYRGRAAATDIRLIFLGEQIIQTYIRRAKPDDFRCNEHQGGQLVYVDLTDIPVQVTELAVRIAQELGTGDSLYALDFIVSDQGNTYLLEGNIGPGLDWNAGVKKNELMSKQLIRRIVAELAARAQQLARRNPDPALVIPLPWLELNGRRLRPDN